MADATVSRLGQINATGATDALFLKVFAGEVLTAFAETNVMMDRHLVRKITNGKSASFPATWKVSASYHTPGAEITGGVVKHGERVITIDDLLIAPVFIANIDEAKNHYDVRSIYSTEVGRALANVFDKNVLQVATLASRASATISGGVGGSVLKNTAYATTADTLAGGLFDAAQALDEKDVADADRFAVFRPAEYYLLIESDKAINRDYDGSGSFSKGKIWEISGIEIVKSNHLPNSNIATGVSTYQGDFSNTVGLVMNKSAVGTVKLLDLALESEYDIRRQGTLMVGKYAVGHGILRPECAVELSKAAS